MRLLLTLLCSFLCSTTSIHVHHAIKQVLDVQHQVLSSDADTNTNTDTNTASTTMVAPFPCAPRTSYDAGTCAGLFGGGVAVGNLVQGGTPGFNGWTLMFGNAAGAVNGYVVHTTCAAAGVPGTFGLYQWGTAAPVGGACPGAPAAVTIRYCGRSIDDAGGLGGRCANYNPNVANWATVGAHDSQRPNFRAQLTAGQCVYYRWADYGPAVLPYVVCQQGEGTRSRPATRSWVPAWTEAEWVALQERALIGNIPSANCPWNLAAGANPARSGNC